MPEESALVEAVPQSAAVQEGWVIYRAVLDRDREFRLYLRRQP